MDHFVVNRNTSIGAALVTYEYELNETMTVQSVYVNKSVCLNLFMLMSATETDILQVKT